MASMAEKLGQLLHSLDQRVTAVETARDLAHSSLDDGEALQIVGPEGEPMALIGHQPDGTVGAVPYAGPPPAAPVGVAVLGGTALTIRWAPGETLQTDWQALDIYAAAEPDAAAPVGVDAAVLAGSITSRAGGSKTVQLGEGAWRVWVRHRTVPGEVSAWVEAGRAEITLPATGAELAAAEARIGAASVELARLTTTETDTPAEGVVSKLWEVLRAKLVAAEKIITGSMIATGAITAEKITVTQQLAANIGEFMIVKAEQISGNYLNSISIIGSHLSGSDFELADEGAPIELFNDGFSGSADSWQTLDPAGFAIPGIHQQDPEATDLGVMLVESETNHAWRDFYCEATEPQRLRVVMRVRGVSFEQKGLTDANLLVRIRDLAGNPAPTLIFELPTSPTDGTWTTVHGETMVFPGGNRISLITAQRPDPADLVGAKIDWIKLERLPGSKRKLKLNYDAAGKPGLRFYDESGALAGEVTEQSLINQDLADQLINSRINELETQNDALLTQVAALQETSVTVSTFGALTPKSSVHRFRKRGSTVTYSGGGVERASAQIVYGATPWVASGAIPVGYRPAEVQAGTFTTINGLTGTAFYYPNGNVSLTNTATVTLPAGYQITLNPVSWKTP